MQMQGCASAITSYILMIAICICALSFAACAGNGSDEGVYAVYYSNTAGNALTKVEQSVEGNDIKTIAQNLLDAMNTKQKRKEVMPVKPDNVILTDIVSEDNILYLYYNDLYKSMDASTEVMYRAAVVKTLTQISGVSYIAIYIGNTPLTQQDGTVIGLMSSEDFVDDSDRKSSELQWSNLTLYFANAKGDRLIPITASVAYGKNVSIEHVVVEQLISGTNTAGCYRTLPANLKLLGISVNDGVCYVNLDSTFLSGMVNVSDMVPVYSIVNSLCELDYINSVQILVNGDSSKMYRESISLQTKFTANSDIVQNTTASVSQMTQ